jgi:manganese transport protein
LRQLLFDIPLSYGVVLTALDVLVILWLQQRGFRYLEAFVMALLGIVFLCFAVNLLAQPVACRGGGLYSVGTDSYRPGM